MVENMEILNKTELAKFLKVKKETINYLLYSKKIPRVKIGKEYRFKKSEIENWINERIERPKRYKF